MRRRQLLPPRIAAYVACVFFSFCNSSLLAAASAELADNGNHAVSVDFPETLHSSGASLTLSSRARSDDFRSLALGDFDALNALYSGTTFTLPSTSVDTKVGGFTLSLSFANIVCRDFNLGDIRLTPVENITTAATTIRSTLQLVDVDIVCSADYRYRYILGTNGGGRADIYTRDNSVSSQIVLRSPDLARFAPDEFILENCATTVNVFDLDFNGGGVVNIVGNILNALDKVLRNVVEREISDFLCQALQDVDDDVAALLGRLTTLLGPYLGDSPDGNGNDSVAVGALQAERDLVVPSDVTLLNFQEPSTQFANVIDLLVEQVGGYFGNTNTGAGTLNINALLRDQILDDNGALVVDLTKLGDFGSGNLLQASNEILGSIAVKIETATVIGLDSFSRFDDLSQIGNFTFQTGFAIEDIRLEIQMELRLQPPASTQSLVEVVQVEIPLDRVDASTSLLLAIDQGRLGSLPLGSLLNDDSVVNCLLSAVFDLQVTSLSIQPALSVGLPTVRGFATPGLQRVVGTAVEIVYDAFYQTLVVALNNFVQSTAIEFLDDAWQGLRNSTTCLTKARGSETALIDFRDLLLSAEESKAYGGNGTNPYGRLASFAKDFLDNELLVNDAAGSPKVNDLVIRPLTRQQSGENGTFALEQDFFAFDDCLGFIGLDTTVHFRVADLLLENLDSIGQPLDLLTPIRDDAIRLNNTLSVGSLSAPLRASFLIDFGIQSAGTIVANKLNVGVGFRSLTAALKLLARFVERDFLSFPIEDILNVHCWLAMLQTPTLDAEGVRIEDSVLSLAIQDLILIVAEMDFVWDCLECSSPQMIEVEEFFQTPQGQEDATSIAEIAIDYLLSLTKGENSFLQSRIDRLLISSATRCPHQPEYNPLPRTLLSNALQLEDTETSACGLGEEVIDMDDTAVTDPLTAEKDLVVPSNVTLLNFEAPSTQFADTVDILIDRISGYLGNRNVEGSLNINSLLRDQILQEDGALLVDMEKLGNFGSGNLFEAGNDLVGELSIAIQTASIFGLDSFQRFDRLSQIGKYTLQANFIIEDIRLEIQTELRLQLPASSRSLVEIVRVEIPLGIVDASTSLLLAIDQGQLGSLPLGSLLHDDSVMNCLLSAVFDLHVTSLRISPGLTIGPPTVLGFVTPGLQRVINAAVDIIYDAIGGELSGSLNNFVQTTAMEFLDDAWQGLRNSTTCLTKAQGSETALIDFRDLLLSAEESKAYGGNGTNPYGSLGVVVKSLIDDELVANDASGVPKMNNFIIKPLTEQQSGIAGTFLLAQEFLAFDQRISFNGLDAKVRFRIADLRVENLDTIREPLALLDPLTNEASRINNTLSMGTPSTPLRISVLLQIGVEGAGTTILNKVNIGVELSSVSVVTKLLARIVERDFLSFPIEDMLNIDCWLATVQTPSLSAQGVRKEDSMVSLGLEDLKLLIGDMNFTVDCIECTSPQVLQIGELLRTPQGQTDAATSAQNVVDYLVSLTQGDNSFLQSRIDRLLVESAKRCPHSPSFSSETGSLQYEAFEVNLKEDSMSFLLGVLVAAGVSVGGTILLTILVKVLVARRNRKWLQSLPSSRALAIYDEQQKHRDFEESIDKRTSSMFRSGQVPLVIRWLVPVFILGNIGMFLSGHLSVGGSVRIYIQIAGERLVFDDFYSFSVAQSAIELWDAGGKELAILILIFSGVWPYTKQILTFLLWFAPPTRVSVSTRGTWLLWLDALAKWSMIDVFVMIISIVAFRVSIRSPSQSFLPDDLYRVDLAVVPVWGLYANLTAQLLSQLSSHVIIHYHRRVERKAQNEVKDEPNESLIENGTKEFESEASWTLKDVPLKSSTTEMTDDDGTTQDEAVEALRSHAFGRPHRGEAEKLHVRRGVNILVVVVAVVLTVMLLLGSLLPSFSFDVQGLAGVAVEAGRNFEQAKDEHSIISIAQLLMDQARFVDTAKDYIGTTSIAVLLVLTVLIVPVLQTCALVVQWFYPMTHGTRRRVESVVEVLRAWQYMEVYVISIVVGAWQLPEVSSFLIGSACDGLQSTFAELVFYGFIEAEDAQCFKVDAAISSGSYVLIAAAVLLAVMNTFICKAVGQVEYFSKYRELFAAHGSLHRKELALEEREPVPVDDINAVPVLFTDRFRWLLRTQKMS